MFLIKICKICYNSTRPTENKWLQYFIKKFILKLRSDLGSIRPCIRCFVSKCEIKNKPDHTLSLKNNQESQSPIFIPCLWDLSTYAYILWKSFANQWCFPLNRGWGQMSIWLITCICWTEILSTASAFIFIKYGVFIEECGYCIQLHTQPQSVLQLKSQKITHIHYHSPNPTVSINNNMDLMGGIL